MDLLLKNVPHKAGMKWHVFNIRNGRLLTVNAIMRSFTRGIMGKGFKTG